MAEPDRNQVFVSYSHKDSKWKDRLVDMLIPLIHHRVVPVWWDDRIKPGQQWLREIEEALAAARVGLLLVSVNFLASEFIMKNELPALLDKAEAGGLTLMWVLVRNCLYQHSAIVKYQAAHDLSKPWNSLTEAELDEVLVNICNKIKNAVESLPPSQQEPIEQVSQEISTAPLGASEAFIAPLPVTRQPISDADRPVSHGRTSPQSDELAKKILAHVDDLDTINDIGSMFILKREWPNAIFTFSKLVNLATPTRQDWMAKGYKNLGHLYNSRWSEDRQQEDFRMAYQCWTLSKNLYLHQGQREHAAEVQSWLEDLARRRHEEHAVKKSGAVPQALVTAKHQP